jgi:hypothetical protein
MMTELLIVGSCMDIGFVAALTLSEANRPEAIWALRPDVRAVVLADTTR